jgi:hypothetical protein
MVTSNVTKLPKQTKAERQAALSKLVPVHAKTEKVPHPAETKAEAKIIDKMVVAAPKVEPPKADESKADTPKKKRKWSAHHLAWKGTKDFPDTARIVVLSAENPKKRTAKFRFDHYKRGAEGMTVGEYIEASHKAGNAKALAKEDIKWDWTAGFISVDGVKAPANTK